jgi:hypothetical protein
MAALTHAVEALALAFGADQERQEGGHGVV